VHAETAYDPECHGSHGAALVDQHANDSAHFCLTFKTLANAEAKLRAVMK
jgi:hypothetical protein